MLLSPCIAYNTQHQGPNPNQSKKTGNRIPTVHYDVLRKRRSNRATTTSSRSSKTKHRKRKSSAASASRSSVARPIPTRDRSLPRLLYEYPRGPQDRHTRPATQEMLLRCPVRLPHAKCRACEDGRDVTGLDWTGSPWWWARMRDLERVCEKQAVCV